MGEGNRGALCGDSAGVGETTQGGCSERREAGSEPGLWSSGVQPGKTRRKWPACPRRTRTGWCPRGNGTESCREGGQCGQTPEKPAGTGQKKIHWL